MRVNNKSLFSVAAISIFIGLINPLGFPDERQSVNTLASDTTSVLANVSSAKILRGRFISVGGQVRSESFKARYSIGANDIGTMKSATFHVGPLTLVRRQFDSSVPNQFVLFQNFPNPFNQGTSFKIGAPKPTLVRVVLYNIRGEKVKTVEDGRIEAGYHIWRWDGRNDDGQEVPTGLYFCRAKTNDDIAIIKLLLVK